MTKKAVARIELAGDRRVDGVLFARAKLQTDAPGHAYGQWSIVLEPFFGSENLTDALAWASFVSENAPVEALAKRAVLDLYYGATQIGTATIVTAPLVAPMTIVDRDVLADPEAPPREAAA